MSEREQQTTEKAQQHDKRGRLDRSICALCGDAYVECSKCGVYLCECSRSEICTPPAQQPPTANGADR